MQRLAATLVFCLAVGACEPDDPCDDGQYYQQGGCFPDTDGGPKDAGEKDAGDTPEDAGGDSGCSEDQSKVLGQSCMNDDGCNCAAPYCAKQPGQTVGYCTVYCTPSPDDCPDGYRCFDLSVLGVPGIKPFCAPK